MSSVSEGYNFNGWMLTSTYDAVDYFAGDTYSAHEDITLYANCNEQEAFGSFLINYRPSNFYDMAVDGDIFRFRGSSSEVTNNFVCFSTTSKSGCINNPSIYMYRVVGVTFDGLVKLIKYLPLNSYPWHTYAATTISWPSSSLFSLLNGEQFLTNSTFVGSNSSMIESYDWYYFTSSTPYTSEVMLYNASAMFTFETTDVSTVNAPIGLLHLHDYYFAASSSNSITCGGNGLGCASSWLNDMGTSSGSYYWLLPQNSTNAFLGGSAHVFQQLKSDSNNTRPVFYLTADTIIISGSGGIDDPFIITKE